MFVGDRTTASASLAGAAAVLQTENEMSAADEPQVVRLRRADPDRAQLHHSGDGKTQHSSAQLRTSVRLVSSKPKFHASSFLVTSS